MSVLRRLHRNRYKWFNNKRTVAVTVVGSGIRRRLMRANRCSGFFFVAFHRLSHSSATSPNSPGGNQLNTRHRTVPANIRPEHLEAANASSTRQTRNDNITRTRRHRVSSDLILFYLYCHIGLVTSVLLSDRRFSRIRVYCDFCKFRFSFTRSPHSRTHTPPSPNPKQIR